MRTSTCVALLAMSMFSVRHASGDGLYGVHSPNGTTVWAAGNGGSVLRSTDGGVTWGALTEGASALRAVYSAGPSAWVVGDNGAYWSSHNGGAQWTSAVLGGGATLRAIVFQGQQAGWVAGNGGTILRTTDGGASWSSQSSTTTQQLNSLSFIDAQTGYAAGAAGMLLKTTNSGSTWTNIRPSGWTSDLLSVNATGQTVYVAGVDGFCSRSSDGGTTWNELNFKTDTRSDVNGVCALSPTNAHFVGGGGFIRDTRDGGLTFTYGSHALLAKLNMVFFSDSMHGWACSEKNNIVLRTTDGGDTWQFPQGATTTSQWVQKFSAGSIGNTFCVNPVNKNIIYVVMGNTVYMSGDRGDSWTSTATIPSGGSTWSFYVSPKDTNLWIAATSGGPDSTGKGVRRSTNRGATWTTRLRRNFTSYGMPLEMDPDHTDNIVFAAEGTSSGPDGIVYLSTDFGDTWDTLAQTNFRSPCDIMIVPGNTNLWYVADGTTGSGQAQMWRSTNYGSTWTSIYSSSSSEIPMIAVSRLRNTEGFATAWSVTSFTKTTNAGLSWSNIAPTSSTWGADIAKDDPNVVIYGTYGGGTTYLSTNSGASFASITLSGSNSGMLAYDRATFLAHQASNGVWKLTTTYTVPAPSAQIIAVDAPHGGEAWAVGSVQNIRWSSTGITGNVKVELSRDGGLTYETLFAGTANDGTEPWTVSGAPSPNAVVRVSSAANPAVSGTSSGPFAITSVFTLLTRLYLHDNGTGSDSLEYGTAAGASDGIDPLFGEFEQPPVPPLGSFDVRWRIPGTEGTKRDIRDTLGGTRQQITYTGMLQPGLGGYPFVVRWNRGTLPSGSFILRDGLDGLHFLVDMKQQDSLVITDESVSSFQLLYDEGTLVLSGVQQNWNIVSLPLTMMDRRKAQVFPTSISNAFAYTSGGYATRDTLDYGIGYWLKFPSAQVVPLSGNAIGTDTIDVVQGWNIIGSISASVPVAGIVQIPSGIVVSQYFGYSGTGYTPAAVISPMQGYWVKVSQNGRLVLSGSLRMTRRTGHE